MQPSRNTVENNAEYILLRFQHYGTFELLTRKTCLKPLEINVNTGCKHASQQLLRNWTMTSNIVQNRSGIDPKCDLFLIGCWIDFRSNLEPTWGQLGFPNDSKLGPSWAPSGTQDAIQEQMCKNV